jgi:hypothetical protein
MNDNPAAHNRLSAFIPPPKGISGETDIIAQLGREPECLKAESFDVVISDIQRDREAVGGIEGAKEIQRAMPTLPIVFYIQNLTSTQVPEPASGITSKPNELLHLVLDRLERARI